MLDFLHEIGLLGYKLEVSLVYHGIQFWDLIHLALLKISKDFWIVDLFIVTHPNMTVIDGLLSEFGMNLTRFIGPMLL